MVSRIPKPSITRLCKIYSLLEELEETAVTSVSSKAIGQRIGVGSHSVRRDISYLGEIGTVGSGYDISKLKAHIGQKLGLNVERKACVVGLGTLGRAIMQHEKLFSSNFKIVAGFDANINLLETIVTDIQVYPTYDIIETVKRNSIELAILTVPGNPAREIAERLIEGGIKGIINLSSAALSASINESVYVSNIDIVGEFRFLSALFTLECGKKQ
jgi:redox-sensing transcriptional repressor